MAHIKREGFEYRVDVRPAFDARPGSDPKYRLTGMKPDDGTMNTNYGIGSCILTFAVIGPKGATSLSLGTKWFLPHVQEELKKKGYSHGTQPSARALAHHSKRPLTDVERQYPHDGCEFLGGSICYGDTNYAEAERITADVLFSEGSDGIWRELEVYYDKKLGGAS